LIAVGYRNNPFLSIHVILHGSIKAGPSILDTFAYTLHNLIVKKQARHAVYICFSAATSFQAVVDKIAQLVLAA
jgi:hypothetical protein